MPDESAARENQRLAHEIQTKFEFWLVGLIFAVLALAVQTATFNGPRVGQFCELVAWVVLLFAGLIGVWRLEWSSPVYRLGSYRAGQEAVLKKLREIEVSGHTKIYEAPSRAFRDLASLMTQVQASIDAVEEQLEPIRKKQLTRYRLMRALVIAGFAVLLVARGYEPALRLISLPEGNEEARVHEPESDSLSVSGANPGVHVARSSVDHDQ